MEKRFLTPYVIALVVVIGACSKPPTETHEAKAERTTRATAPPSTDAAESSAARQAAPTPEKPLQAVSPDSKIQLPEGFAKDVPIYPGAVIKTFSRAPQNRSQQLQYVAKTTLEEVSRFYAEAAQLAGWSFRDESGDVKTKRFRLDKEARMIEVMLSPSETGTTCTLMLAQP